MLRGGAFKPRTSPYAFQGLGKEGPPAPRAREKGNRGFPSSPRCLTSARLADVAEFADVLQVGARNMQNFALLKELGQLKKPVMLKRGLSATLDEWLMSAEYLLSEGNKNIFLCERGIRAFSDHARNTLDLNVVPAVKEMSHLPIIVDPSHATGVRAAWRRWRARPSRPGAHGVMIEVHDRPDQALCDGPQALHPDDFAVLMNDLAAIAGALGARWPRLRSRAAGEGPPRRRRRPPPGRGARAGRQVGLASRVDPRRAGRRARPLSRACHPGPTLPRRGAASRRLASRSRATRRPCACAGAAWAA